jgi:hypothetical protein
MAKRIKRTQIVDAVSGEVLQENRETVYTSEAYIPGRGYRLYSRKHIRLGKEWKRTMSLRDWGWLVKVILAMDESNVATPDIRQLAKENGVSSQYVYRMLATLRRHGAITKVSGGYAVNPAVAFAGTYLSPQLYRMFERDLEAAVPSWAKALYQREAE